jgi:indole-3-glycerol phosphate synthase
MSILERILSTKRDELSELRARRLPSPPPAPAFDLRRVPGERLRLITEIKRRSPSAGELSTKLSVTERAAAYERAGADAISVLCDGAFFDGRYEHLLEARAGSQLPLLCKEFILDEVQLDAARAFGASAALLIVRCLEPERVEVLVREARARGLEPLVEITNHEEARIAVAAGATVIGVNARDLDTLVMNVERAREVLAQLPSTSVKLHLSGLSAPEAVLGVARSSADGALMGEALMRADDPVPLLESFVRAARS